MFSKPELVDENNPTGSSAFLTLRESTYLETEDETNHAAFSMSTNYKFNNQFYVDATFGLDFVSQRSSNFTPFGWDVDGYVAWDTDGALSIAKRVHKEWTLDLKGNWKRNFTPDISSAFIIGFQGFKSTSKVNGSDVDLFPGPGLEVLDAGANQTAYSVFSEIVEAGLYVQEQLGYKDYLYLTGGARFDANSAFGSEFNTQTYPKLGVSFIPTTAFNISSNILTTLRLRTAWGKSGQQPGAFDQFTTFAPQSSTAGAGLASEQLGDPTLKPEVSSEIEAGFEAGLFNERLGFEFTYWDRVVKDALIYRFFPPSGGFRRAQLSNIGQIDANGIDLLVNISVLRKENFSLDLFANAAYLDQVVTSLGGAPEQKVSSSYTRIRNYLKEGHYPGAFFGAILADDPYPIDIDGDGIANSREDLLSYFTEPRDPSDWDAVLKDEDGDGDFLDNYLGKPTPDWQGAFGFKIGFLKNFRLSSLFEYKTGNFSVTNLTDAFRKSHPAIGRNTEEAAATHLILLDPNSTAEQRLEAALKWENNFRALAPYSGLNTIEKADFVRIREISLTYDLPSGFTSRFGLKSASFSISGRNLHIFTGYSGIDPEQNWYGRGGANGVEVSSAQDTIDNQFLNGVDAFGVPLARQFLFKFRVGF